MKPQQGPLLPALYRLIRAAGNTGQVSARTGSWAGSVRGARGEFPQLPRSPGRECPSHLHSPGILLGGLGFFRLAFLPTFRACRLQWSEESQGSWKGLQEEVAGGSPRPEATPLARSCPPAAHTPSLSPFPSQLGPQPCCLSTSSGIFSILLSSGRSGW